MTYSQLVHEYFPSVSDSEVEYILWTHTGYPCFWSPEDGDTEEQCLRKQLGELKARKGER